MKYRATTNDVEVCVEPDYIGTKVIEQVLRYVWSYDITLINRGDRPVKLVNRHWQITDAVGYTEIVDGEGVIGDQPTLNPGTRYSYRSFSSLATPSGFMGGHYEMQHPPAGSSFKAEIPTFSLDSPDARPTIN